MISKDDSASKCNAGIDWNKLDGVNGNAHEAVQYNELDDSNVVGANGANGSNGANVSLEAPKRKRIVIVGLGMVAVAFMEKILKYDTFHRYEILVIGEEAHLGYNRVGLTQYFEHRKVEQLYLNPAEWYESQPDVLHHMISTRVAEIHADDKEVLTSAGQHISYDILVLATGSDAFVPKMTPGHDATGVFVYRNIADLEKLIAFSAKVPGSTAAVVGGGLLGLEAAKAMMDLKQFGGVKIIELGPWVLARQLDQDAGNLVIEKITELGIDVLCSHKIKSIDTTEDNQVKSVTFDDGKMFECSTVCIAIGVTPRDDLAQSCGLKKAPRGGFTVDKYLETSIPGIYAIGECASWENQTFGLIAPGVEMAEVLAYNLCMENQERKAFRRPDLSTKLKLLGVNVASFGDFFADRDGPTDLPESERNSRIKALSYKDPFDAVYKKYLFTADKKYLLGGMIIGDTSDYIKLVSMVRSKKPLEVPPSQFILGAKKDGEEDNVDDLPDDTQICSCHNVTKGEISAVVKNGTCKSLGEVKSCTKAGTGCGGCVPMMETIFKAEMKALGAEVKNHLCLHFEYSRADLFNIIAVKKLETFEAVMKEVGKHPDSLGCEICKPTLASILSSLFNRHVMSNDLHGLQDTNDKFLANIQRNGSFSVVPRVPGGEITPDKLMAIAIVAKKYNLYCKITGGQRIDMFGAQKQDLLDIWTELVNAGMESGHAYAKSLRTVKSCVGTTFCRFGIGDSVGMAIRLENRYKSIRSPHKLKGGVSGCVRECAEAQNKDFGLIATEKGFNILVGGNGGAKPRHSELLIKDCPIDQVMPVLDRYLMFYIRTADRLQRTARWIESLPGGIKYLREVVLDDRLGICAELERQMAELVGSYFCEWTEVVKNPAKRKVFQQFANTPETTETIEVITERDQKRPTYWAKDSATEDFKALSSKWSSLSWQPLIEASYFADADSRPSGISAAVKRGDTQLAIFKVRGKYYATQQMCPHKRAFVLSDGLVGDDEKGNTWVSCPMHKRNFVLNGEGNGNSGDGETTGAGGCMNDSELSVAMFEVEEKDDGWVYVKLPSVEELDEKLGTKKWMVKECESEKPFEKLDKAARTGRKVGRGEANGVLKTNGGIDW